MTAQFKLTAGTAATPGLGFSTDTDTGIYSIGANNVGLSIGGTKTLDVSASTTAVSQGDLNCSAGKLQEAGASLIPPGCMFDYGGSSAPTGYLICDGSAVSRTTYADLFTALSTTYGVGDGSTTFNIPDRTGRVSVGKEASATRLTSAGGGVDGATLGATGGGETHALVEAELATHTHTFTGDAVSNHDHTTNAGSSFNAASGGSAVVSFTTTASSAAGGHTPTGTNASTGSDTAHANVQPTLVVNIIIKT